MVEGQSLVKQALDVGHLNYIKDYIHNEVIINVAYEREQVLRIHHVTNAVIIMLEQEVIVTAAVAVVVDAVAVDAV